jgi:acyl-coenzyme A thioesterase PaaI-like protein
MSDPLADDTATDIPALLNSTMGRTIPVLEHMGLEVIEAAPGRAAARVPMGGNGNHVGTMYAGVLFSVAEMLGGALSLATFDPARYYPIVKDLRIDFRRPATSAVTARTSLDEAEIDRVLVVDEIDGKGLFVLRSELTDADGTLVASTEGTYQIRPHVHGG